MVHEQRWNRVTGLAYSFHQTCQRKLVGVTVRRGWGGIVRDGLVK